MRQLPLDIQLADYALFETYFDGANASVVHALRESLLDGSTGPGNQLIWLWGTPESGKSHLLQALVAAAADLQLRSMWLPFDGIDLGPAMLEGMGGLDLICIDDVQVVAGQAEWERALFRLFEDSMQQGVKLVITANAAPNAVGFQLPDLISRMNWGTTFRLQALSDEDSVQALQKRAAWRGLELPAETARYLLSRVHRSPGTLFALLDKLDKEALVAQRRLTVPFVKSVLDT